MGGVEVVEDVKIVGGGKVAGGGKVVRGVKVATFSFHGIHHVHSVDHS